MSEWLLALAFLAVFLIALPFLLTRAKRSASKGGGGFVVGLGMFLATVFDPACKAPVEQIDRQRENELDEEEAGGPPR